MNKFSLDFGNNLNKKLDDLYSGHQALVVSLADKCYKSDFGCLKYKNDLLCLAVIIEYLKFTKAEYEKRNIDNSVFYDTIKDIEIWCKNNSNKGLRNYNWIKNHLKCELFKIGRLQYQIYPCRNLTLNYDKLPFNFGDNLVYVHIPQGEKLDFDACAQSLKDAKAFFSEYFPDYEFKYFFTETWLLYSKNVDFMSADSNIIKFQSLFEHHYDFAYEGQALERVFGKRRLFKKNYPENTTLQQQLKEYMLSGGRAGLGIATIDKDTIG